MSGYVPADVLAVAQTYGVASLDIPGCQIQRAAIVTSASGYVAEPWVTLATVMCGMAKPTASIMAKYASMIGTQESWVVSLPLGTPVARNDQMLVNGLTLRVQADLTHPSYPVLTQVLASAIR